MLKKQELKENLLGCFEIILLMRSGIDRFKCTSRENAIKSFIIPVIFLPLVLTVLVVTSAEGYSIPFILSVHLIRIVAGLTIGLSIIYFVSKQYERHEHFYKFLVIVNWFSLFDIILVSPVLFYIFSGADATEIEAYAVFITLLGYIYSAFIITHCFRMPWQMGGFVAIIGMAIDESMWDILFMTCGNITLINGT